MEIKLTQTLQRIPTPIAGLALGLASLGVCLENRLPAGGLIQGASAAIAALLLCLLLGKFLTNPKQLWHDMGHAVIGSVLPTFAMALMIIAKWVGNTFPQAGVVIWYLGVTMHLLLLAGFLFHRLQEREWHFMVPSWFVPPVGIIVAAVSCPGAEQKTLALWLMGFGMTNYLLMLAPMFYRLIFHPEVPDHAKPTIAILAAPASVTLAGYLNIVDTPDTLLVALLLGIAITMTALVYIAFFHLLRLPFSPGYAAFTFPMVIGATAMYRCAAIFEHWNRDDALWLYRLADLELIIASAVVIYVAVRYAEALLFNATHSIFRIEEATLTENKG